MSKGRKEEREGERERELAVWMKREGGREKVVEGERENRSKRYED